MLSVLYYGADGESVGGHRICPSADRVRLSSSSRADELRRKLLERKAS